MANTTNGFPYPVGTDNVRDGDDAIKALALAVETILASPPRAKIVATAAQNIATGAATYLTFASVAYDNAAMADTANNRLVVKRAGYYRIGVHCSWANNQTGYRALLIHGGGLTVADSYVMATSTSGSNMTVTTDPIPLAVNDIIQVRGMQGSGATLATTGANALWPSLAAAWVGY